MLLSEAVFSEWKGDSNKKNPLETYMSSDMYAQIDKVVKVCPDIVFGGSIALVALGLLEREPKDIDIFLKEDSPLMPTIHNLIHDVSVNFEGSHPTEDINGAPIKRIPGMLGDLKVCVFQLPHLTYSPYRLFDNIINIQSINEAILAKKRYSDITQSKGKHLEDLKEVYNNLQNLILS